MHQQQPKKTLEDAWTLIKVDEKDPIILNYFHMVKFLKKKKCIAATF